MGCLVGCDGGSCDLRCSFADCAFEAAGDSRVRCETVSACSTVAGEELNLTCTQAASCTFDAGAESSLRCTQSSCRGRLGHSSFVDQRTGGALDVDLGDDAGVLCTGSGACTARTGARSTVTCGALSQCTLTVGDNSTVSCSSTCDVTCRGTCTVFGPSCTASCAPDYVLFTTPCRCARSVPIGPGDAGFDPGRDGGNDAGPMVDAGLSLDAGIDAGPMVDAGLSLDAGIDAGAAADAGSLDGGVDGGSAPDAGIDAGLFIDAGPMVHVGPMEQRDAGAVDAGLSDLKGDYIVGCGCASAGPIAFNLGLLALLKRRR